MYARNHSRHFTGGGVVEVSLKRGDLEELLYLVKTEGQRKYGRSSLKRLIF